LQTKDPNQEGIVKFWWILLFAGACSVFAAQPSSAQTLAVGTCRPHLVSYPTISEAIAAAPSGATVLVCPGDYPEQITISQPLTLRGLTLGLGVKPLISLPCAGLVGNFPAQISAQTPSYDSFGPVTISNLRVQGSASGENCSTVRPNGIEFAFANGAIENVELSHQDNGILLFGGNFDPNFVNIQNSGIRDFDSVGVSADSNGGSGFLVNFTSNWVASSSKNVQAGVIYDMATGDIMYNTIAVGGPIGLELDNYFCCVTAGYNTVSGSGIGIYMGGSYFNAATNATHNSLYNNGTGVYIYQSQGIDDVNWNTIFLSAAAGIDLDCSANATVRHNSIYQSPVGIGNVTPGDTLAKNGFYGVFNATTTCN
jgi:hypothetical protein